MSQVEAPVATTAPPRADEFTLADLLATAWSLKWLVLVGGLVGLVLASLFLRGATYRWTADLQVSPVESQAGSLISRLGGLASVAGIDLPRGEEATPFDYFSAAIFSPEVARGMSRDRRLMRGAFAEEWSGAGWREPQGGLRGFIGSAKRLLGVPIYPWRPPGADRLGDWIEENVKVIENNSDVLVTVSLTHEDPRFAAAFLDKLHTTADEVVRAKTLARTSANIAYLRRTLAVVVLAEHRGALADALGEQERRRMLASGDVAFAADRFGDVKISTRPTNPKPVVVLGVGLVLGALLAALAGLVARLVRSRRRARLAFD